MAELAQRKAKGSALSPVAVSLHKVALLSRHRQRPTCSPDSHWGGTHDTHIQSYSCSDDEGACCPGARWWSITSAAHVSAVNLSLPALQIPPPASSAVSCNTTHRFFFQLCHPRTGSRRSGQGRRTMVNKQCVKQQHKWKSTEVKAFDLRAVVMEALPRKGRLEASGHFKTPQLCFLLRSECFRCFPSCSLTSCEVPKSDLCQICQIFVLLNSQITSCHLLYLTDCSFETEAKIGSKMKCWDTAKKPELK